MRRYYSFAGVDLELNIPDDLCYTEQRHLAPFVSGPAEGAHRFYFDLVDALTPPSGVCVANEGGFRVYADGEDRLRYIGSVRNDWEQAYLRVSHRGREHHVQMKRAQYTDRIGVHTVLNCLSAEHLVAQAGGFILHSSYIESEGKGILFTAPSGTGKSTQADLWAALRGVEILNGDRAAVRVTGEGVQVCGVPFAGSSKFCADRTLPLAAVVYLKQAPRTTIRRLRGAEAFRRVWEGCSVNTWDRGDVELVSETVQKVLMTVPVFELACTPDESAILALEGALNR